MELKDLKKWIIPAILVGIVVYIIYKKGKNAGADASLIQLKYPNGGKDIRKSFDANGLAIKLYDVLKGIFTWANTKEKVFVELNACSNEEIIATYNAFNKKYGNQGSGTLTKWIKDDSQGFFANVVIGSIAKQLIERMESIGAV